MIISREFICFAMLCLLASSGTELWEHSMKFDDREIRATDELALSLPLTLLGAASLVFAVKNDSMLVRPFFYAILTGAALLAGSESNPRQIPDWDGESARKHVSPSSRDDI